MSLSHRKKQLLRKAVGNYHLAKKIVADGDGIDWSLGLMDLMERDGWRVGHPGADKRIAIKGPIIAKWAGKCGWSHNPIAGELSVYRHLRRVGLKKHTPRVYLKLGDFMVQQYLGEKQPDPHRYRCPQETGGGLGSYIG